MTELATAADYNIEGLDELGAVWREAAQGDPNFRPMLPTLRVPAGGGTTWEDAGNASFAPRRELECVILHSQVTTQLYLESFDNAMEESRRPDAWSDDGIVQAVPVETYAKIDALNQRNGWNLPYPSTDLRQCPFNKFVGDPGAAIAPGQTGGKWNSEYHELYVIVKGEPEPVPHKVRVSPANIKQWASRSGYKNTLLSRGVRLHTLETIITLTPVKGVGSIVYSEMHFNRGRQLDPALKAAMGEMAKSLAGTVQGGMFGISPQGMILAAAPVVAALPAGQPMQVTPHAPQQIAAPPAPQQYVDVESAIPAAPQLTAAVELDQAFAAAAADPDPGVQNIADTFGATPVTPMAAAPAAVAPAPQVAPVPAPQQAQPAPVPAQVAPVAAPVAQAAPVLAAVGSGAAEDSIDF